MNIGTDIVDIKRFEKLKTDRLFMEKIFLSSELEYIKSRNNNTATIAGIYAAKEALLKAFKMGINNYPLKDIEIMHDSNNAPYIVLHNDIKQSNEKEIDVSISHDGDYAIAIVIVSNYSNNN